MLYNVGVSTPGTQRRAMVTRRIVIVRQGSNERDRSSSTERSSPVILSPSLRSG